MKVDAPLYSFDAPEDEVRRLESKGYAGAFTYEGPHDPFFPLLLASRASTSIDLYTAVAIGFARNPMILANIGWDLQAISQGRFLLGLGTQIRPHIEKRFDMPWSKPAKRMREMVLAIKSIWHAWENGERLDFRGEIYSNTLMTPMFDPGPAPYGLPPIFLAGVGPRMTEVCGEVADGFFVHPFGTARSFAELTLPALDRGLAAGGRSADAFSISLQVMVCTGASDEAIEQARQATKQQIAFYGSTPAYRGVLDVHGWGDMQDELNRLSKSGEWVKMGEVIDDEVLNTFAVVGEPEQIGGELKRRYGDIVDRLSFYAPYKSDPGRWAKVLDDLRAA